MLAQGDDIVPIPGTKRRKYLDENLGAVRVTLTAEEMKALDDALPPGKTSGPRYGGKLMALVNR